MKPTTIQVRDGSRSALLPSAAQEADAGLFSRFGLRWDSQYDRLLDAMNVPQEERVRVVLDLLTILHPVLDAYLAEVKAAARRANHSSPAS